MSRRNRDRKATQRARRYAPKRVQKRLDELAAAGAEYRTLEAALCTECRKPVAQFIDDGHNMTEKVRLARQAVARHIERNHP